jgi:hypothetical protein
MTDLFTGCTSLSQITFGPQWNFVMRVDDTSILPAETWYAADGTVWDATTLIESWNSSLAGTYTTTPPTTDDSPDDNNYDAEGDEASGETINPSNPDTDTINSPNTSEDIPSSSNSVDVIQSPKVIEDLTSEGASKSKEAKGGTTLAPTSDRVPSALLAFILLATISCVTLLLLRRGKLQLRLRQIL